MIRWPLHELDHEGKRVIKYLFYLNIRHEWRWNHDDSLIAYIEDLAFSGEDKEIELYNFLDWISLTLSPWIAAGMKVDIMRSSSYFTDSHSTPPHRSST